MKPVVGVMIPQKHWKLVKVIKDSYNHLSVQIKHTTYSIVGFVVYFIPLIILWGLVLGLVFLIGRKIYYRFLPELFSDLRQLVMTFTKRKTSDTNKEIEPTDSTLLTSVSSKDSQTLIIGMLIVAAIITLFVLYNSISYRHNDAQKPIIGIVPQNIKLPSNSYTNIYLLTGNWKHEKQQTSIRMEGNNKLILCNEQGDCATGYLSTDNVLVVPLWNVTGSINRNTNIISWSNGTLWTRN